MQTVTSDVVFYYGELWAINLKFKNMRKQDRELNI